MDRALDNSLLATATNRLRALPTPEQLANLLGDAELHQILGQAALDAQLIETGWCLFGAATSPAALEMYGVAIQRAALQVAGHIFDLSLSVSGQQPVVRLCAAFAAQVSYLHGELDPNALAIGKQATATWPDFPTPADVTLQYETIALRMGLALLGLDLRTARSLSCQVTAQADGLARSWGIDLERVSIFGPTVLICRAGGALIRFLEKGDRDALQAAQDLFRQAEEFAHPCVDPHARWIASHLLSMTHYLSRTSIWSVLSANVPDVVKRAFAIGKPRTLTLWPPQLAFIRTNEPDQSPFSANARRLFLSTPTSGGKTLLAQMMILDHVSSRRGRVCYVAPTRSLCSEVRRSLAERMRFTSATYQEGSFAEQVAELPLDDTSDVVILTPESLNARLRSDMDQVLEEFSLFIFDEVHCVGDQGRGWIAEQTITLLHSATLATNHRIALVSAVVGNRAHFIQWMNDGYGVTAEYHSEWRGPRRVTGIWNTTPIYARSVESTTPRGERRRAIPLRGQLTLRLGHANRMRSLQTAADVGTLVLTRAPGAARWSRDARASTAFKASFPILLGSMLKLGGCLVIAGSRRNAAAYAQEFSRSLALNDGNRLDGLIDLIRARLGEEHPLFECARHGVAFHHGALPMDIRAGIEEAASSGALRCVVATTTMTEGVNLPVKSVVIAERSVRTGEDLTLIVKGSRLANAIGRAGRAGIETEGLVILALQEEVTARSFDALDVSEDDMAVISSLVSNEALSDLARLEDAARRDLDAIVEDRGNHAAEFVSFVWHIASLHDAEEEEAICDAVAVLLSHSLAARQATDEHKQLWTRLSRYVVGSYSRTSPDRRVRWARSGNSVCNARRLEDILDAIMTDVAGGADVSTPASALGTIFTPERLGHLSQLSGYPHIRVKSARAGRGIRDIQIDVVRFLQSWVSGVELHDLARLYFGEVRDVAFRFEQLSDYTTQYCEHFLPNILRTLIAWVNLRADPSGETERLPTSLPGFVRWGVDSDAAMRLMVAGLRSRLLARRIAEEYDAAPRADGIVRWLGALSVAEIIRVFEPSQYDLRDILECSRRRRRNVLSMAAARSTVAIRVEGVVADYAATEVTLHSIADIELSPLGIFHGEELLGKVCGRDQIDLQVLMDSGLQYRATFSARAGAARLELGFEVD